MSAHRKADELSSINGVNAYTDTHTHTQMEKVKQVLKALGLVRVVSSKLD